MCYEFEIRYASIRFKKKTSGHDILVLLAFCWIFYILNDAQWKSFTSLIVSLSSSFGDLRFEGLNYCLERPNVKRHIDDGMLTTSDDGNFNYFCWNKTQIKLNQSLAISSFQTNEWEKTKRDFVKKFSNWLYFAWMRNILFMCSNIVICFRTLLISLSSNFLTNMYELGSPLLQNIALKETHHLTFYIHIRN